MIISNNPESVSAAYDVCDQFTEPITLENILEVAWKEISKKW